MRRIALFPLLAGVLFLSRLAVGQDVAPKPVGSMSQLMINILYPTSNAIFYVFRAAPKDEAAFS